MSKYRKVAVSVWNDRKFMSLSHYARYVFLFLLTHPDMTMLGAMRATVSGLAAELEMEDKLFRKSFAEVADKGMVRHEDSFIWLPHFLRYNEPANPNVVKSWRTVWDLLPECPLRSEMWCALTEYAKRLPQPFAEAFAKVFGELLAKPLAKPSRIQEQEQEEEQEEGEGEESIAKRSSFADANFSDDLDEEAEFYARLWEESLPNRFLVLFADPVEQERNEKLGQQLGLDAAALHAVPEGCYNSSRFHPDFSQCEIVQQLSIPANQLLYWMLYFGYDPRGYGAEKETVFRPKEALADPESHDCPLPKYKIQPALDELKKAIPLLAEVYR